MKLIKGFLKGRTIDPGENVMRGERKVVGGDGILFLFLRGESSGKNPGSAANWVALIIRIRKGGETATKRPIVK